MAQKLYFKDAAKARDSITKKQAKEIRSFYYNVAKDLQKEMERYKYLDTATGALQRQRIADLQKSLDRAIEGIGKQVEQNIKSGILDVSQSMCIAATKLAKEYGFGIDIAYGRVPDDVVRKLITGQVYDSGWSLSNRIWNMNKVSQKDIYKIVAAGTAENKGAYDIAKDLEEYVNPYKKKPWNLKMADGKRIYKKQVDYSAQRLARTLTQHAYQQSMLEVTKNNPWLKYYIWNANGSRACPLCRERDGNRYTIENLPMDHPQGMCIIEPDFVSDKVIVNDIADWINEDWGTYKEIDMYCSELTGLSLGELYKGDRSRFMK